VGCEDEQSPIPNVTIKNVALKFHTPRYLYGVTGTNFPFQHTGCSRWNMSYVVRILFMLNYNGITKKNLNMLFFLFSIQASTDVHLGKCECVFLYNTGSHVFLQCI